MQLSDKQGEAVLEGIAETLNTTLAARNKFLDFFQSMPERNEDVVPGIELLRIGTNNEIFLGELSESYGKEISNLTQSDYKIYRDQGNFYDQQGTGSEIRFELLTGEAASAQEKEAAKYQSIEIRKTRWLDMIANGVRRVQQKPEDGVLTH